eukprot:1728818-Prymnesium_polylepis.1
MADLTRVVLVGQVVIRRRRQREPTRAHRRVVVVPWSPPRVGNHNEAETLHEHVWIAALGRVGAQPVPRCLRGDVL